VNAISGAEYFCKTIKKMAAALRKRNREMGGLLLYHTTGKKNIFFAWFFMCILIRGESRRAITAGLCV